MTIVRDFLKMALADKPALEFRVPPGIKLIRIDPKTWAMYAKEFGALFSAYKGGENCNC